MNYDSNNFLASQPASQPASQQSSKQASKRKFCEKRKA
jgi:hypothetical protein